MEDFVPYELAVKLKEKGFKEKCIAYYWEKINEHTASFVVVDNMPEDGICILDFISEHNKSEWSPFIDAPTISQVLKWLREEKKMFVQISLFQYCYDYCILDTEMVYYDNEHKVLRQGPTGYSYNEAALAGVEYVLDNLI